jgi:hypothetical protein
MQLAILQNLPLPKLELSVERFLFLAASAAFLICKAGAINPEQAY